MSSHPRKSEFWDGGTLAVHKDEPNQIWWSDTSIYLPVEWITLSATFIWYKFPEKGAAQSVVPSEIWMSAQGSYIESDFYHFFFFFGIAS
jgi:hypothetical protein